MSLPDPSPVAPPIPALYQLQDVAQIPAIVALIISVAFAAAVLRSYFSEAGHRSIASRAAPLAGL